MSLESYFKSHDFRMFLDEPLRENAYFAVERFLENHKAVKNTQLHSIPGIIQAKGLGGLRDLIINQKEKNTKKENKAFWGFISELILTVPGPEYSLRSVIEKQPRVKVLLEDQEAASERKERKRIRRENKTKVENVMEKVLPVYFEHFNCHYFYMNR